ncbi:MAG: DUF1599 domain-containing protein [Aureispira sp.]|nr:DUF1599 domain-containing protein [Aureispira sp.]
MAKKTLDQYQEQLAKCRDIFLKKTTDYGTAWRILRPSSLTDQLFIKAKRIRSIEEKGEQKIEEGVGSEYIGLINYSIMALIQLELDDDAKLELPVDHVTALYDRYAQATFELMKAKNHDYGEAWRDMRRSSLTDLILMKILRTKQIEDNDGQTLISEGLDANYQDMINYAVFALIKLSEEAA